MSNAPVKEIRLGVVKCSIWLNEGASGKRYSSQITRIYKSADGWKSSSSFGKEELPLVGRVADMACVWIYHALEADRRDESNVRDGEEKRG